MAPKNLIMADGHVGQELTEWLIDNYRDDVGCVVTTAENRIHDVAQNNNVHTLIFKSSQQTANFITENNLEFDTGFLLWWPKIIKKPLIDIPRHGFVNTHPSLLPHSRGKHYNFWTLVEQTPFGVTLHKVNEGIDTGDIVAQQEIPYGWTDTGGTLHAKALEAMIILFKQSYPDLRHTDPVGVPQDLNHGSAHFANEIDAASHIDLDASYSARELLNLLRARSFAGKPACWFEDGGETYEIRVEVSRKD